MRDAICVLIMAVIILQVRCDKQQRFVLQTKPGVLPVEVHLRLPMSIFATGSPLNTAGNKPDTFRNLHLDNMITESLTQLLSGAPGFQNVDDIHFKFERQRTVKEADGVTLERKPHLKLNFQLACTVGHSLSSITEYVRAKIKDDISVAGGLVDIPETIMALDDRYKELPNDTRCIQSDVYTVRCPGKDFICQNRTGTKRVECVKMCSTLLNPCQNGGKCDVSGKKMVCNCRDSTYYIYSGVHCEHSFVKLPFTIAINIGIDLFIVFVVIISIIVYRRRRHTDNKAKAKGSEEDDAVSMTSLGNGHAPTWHTALDNEYSEIQSSKFKGDNLRVNPDVRVVKDKKGFETVIYQPRGSLSLSYHDNDSMAEGSGTRLSQGRRLSGVRRASDRTPTANTSQVNGYGQDNSKELKVEANGSASGSRDRLPTPSPQIYNGEKFQISRPRVKTTNTQF